MQKSLNMRKVSEKENIERGRSMYCASQKLNHIIQHYFFDTNKGTFNYIKR